MSLLSLRKRAAPPMEPGEPAEPGGWTPAEITWLKENFATATTPILRSRYPDRTIVEIYRSARALGLAWHRDSRAIEVLYANGLGVPGVTLEQMTELNRLVARRMKVRDMRELVPLENTPAHRALLYLGVSPTYPRLWMPGDDAAIRKAYARRKFRGAREAVPGRSRAEIRQRLVALDLSRGCGKLGEIWDERYLRIAIARKTPFDLMSFCLQASPSRIVEHAKRLGIGDSALAACPALVLHREARSGVAGPADAGR